MAGGTDLHSLTTVVATVTMCMWYARFAACRLRPGLPRLAAFLPVLVVLPYLPLAFRAVLPRLLSAFFLTWFAEFRLLLLASGQDGPLNLFLPFSTFVALAALPITRRNPKTTKTGTSSGLGVFAAAVMAAMMVVTVSLYQYRERMNEQLLVTLFTGHVYLTLELILTSVAAASRSLLDLDLEPQFDRPYFSTSLRDFWGRRWNCSVPALLRLCVYRPVHACLGGGQGGAFAGAFASFFVSGLMHEVMQFYATLQPPRGVATAFFVLHGLCTVTEGWWAAHKEWPRPPRLLATPLTLAFILATACWLLFPPYIRPGGDKEIVAECKAVITAVHDAIGWTVLRIPY